MLIDQRLTASHLGDCKKLRDSLAPPNKRMLEERYIGNGSAEFYQGLIAGYFGSAMILNDSGINNENKRSIINGILGFLYEKHFEKE